MSSLIASVTCLQVRLPFDHRGPAPLFAGRARTTLDSAWVRVELENGLVGWGESYGADLDAVSAIFRNQGALQIPKEFALGLRIFKNGDGYKLRARLKYRLGGGSVKFWYELDRPERAIEDAFAGYIDQVREKSGYTVLVASAG